jgi:hypothetical protein
MLDESASGGRDLGSFLALLFAVVVAALASEFVVRAVLGGVRRRLVRRMDEALKFWPLPGLASLDALALAALWLVGNGLAATWFRGAGPQAQLAALIVQGVFFWRLYALGLRLFLRPNLAPARLVKVSNPEARTIYWRLSSVIAVVIAVRLALRLVTSLKASPDAVSAWQLTGGAIGLVVILWVAVSLRKPVSNWLGSLVPATGSHTIGRALARNWLI